MLRLKSIPHILIATYILITFGSYLSFVYPLLVDLLILIPVIFILKLRLEFNGNRLIIFFILTILYLHSSYTFDIGLLPRKYSVFVPFLAFISRNDLLIIYKNFVIIFIIATIPSLIILVAHVIGIESFIPSYSLEAGRTFIIFPGTALQPTEYNSIAGLSFYRISGIQGEPGGLGAICLLILLAEKFNLQNRINKIILFLGLISFSFAFYVLSFSYLILVYISSSEVREGIRKMGLLFAAVIILIVQSSLFSIFINERVENINIENPQGKNTRLIVSNGTFLDYFFKQDVPEILVGRGNMANAADNAYYGAQGINYMAYFYNFGILNVLLLFSLLFYLFYNGAFIGLLTWLIIIGYFYQRPSIINNGYFFLFFIISIKINNLWLKRNSFMKGDKNTYLSKK
ncbi:MAG: hypothetical protein Q7U54_12400 [Bacteroidales bacterium]|nr:hypothetical protein [Bacteroidales bacterium]